MIERAQGPLAGREPAPAAGAHAPRGELVSGFGDDVSAVAVTPHLDARGRLVEFDFGALPIKVRRVFVVTDVPAGTARGGHRHRYGSQVLFCLAGRVEVELSRADARAQVALTPETDGLRIAAGVWSRQRYVNERSELLVLASEPFDLASYDDGP